MLWRSQLSDELTEFSYDADVAGLHYRVFNSNTGIRLMLSGYSHKLPILLEKVWYKAQLCSPACQTSTQLPHQLASSSSVSTCSSCL